MADFKNALSVNGEAVSTQGHTHSDYLNKNGTVPLTADWDIGASRVIKAASMLARDGNGLALKDDGGNLGIFIKDGGDVGFGTTSVPTNTGYKTVAFGAQGGVQYDNSGFYQFNNNAYWDGATYRYIATGAAARLLWTNGRSIFQYAPSGTAGDALTFQEGIRLQEDGTVGLGVSAPQGRLHVHDGTGGKLFVTKTGVAGTEVDVIPNGTGDVTRGYSVRVFARGSSGTKVRGTWEDDGFTDGDTPAAGSVEVGFGFNSATSAYRITLKLYASGRLTVRRTDGAESWDVTLDLIWQ